MAEPEAIQPRASKTHRFGLARAGAGCAGLAVAALLAWRALSPGDLVLLFKSWAVPAAVTVHLVQQAGCGCAWRSLIEPPCPSRWTFFSIRCIRSSVATLVPVSGIGAALIAIRLAMKAGMRLDVAGASLTLDATIEMAAQIVFTLVGVGLLLTFSPELELVRWSAIGLGLGGMALAMFIGVQRFGGLRLVEAGLTRLTSRWPHLLPMPEARLHDQLMRLHRRHASTAIAGVIHLGSWLFGAAEIWLIGFAVGHPLGLASCVIIESLGMVARSAGFLIPGALGVQDVTLVMIGKLVGIPIETAILIAVAKRLREISIAVPGLLLWQWIERGHLRAVLPVLQPTDPAQRQFSSRPVK